MGNTKFNMEQDFEVLYFGKLRSSNRIMCDYIRKYAIAQNDNTFEVTIGYVGRDRETTKPRYVFVDNMVYHIEENNPMFVDWITGNEFSKWLLL